jgi:hypothetical protein
MKEGENMTAFELWKRAKKECPPGSLLLFRIGDYYEMFGADAVAAAGILGMSLTKRGGEPMCGVPYHAVELYIEKLVRAGKKVVLGDPLATRPLGLDAGGAEAVGCRGEGEEAMQSKKKYYAETSTGPDAGTSRAKWRMTGTFGTLDQVRQDVAVFAGEFAAQADNGTEDEWWRAAEEAKTANPGDVIGGGALERAWRIVEDTEG